MVSHEPGEEDLDARELLCRAYSAGPVSPTCYDLKGESCYALDNHKSSLVRNTSVAVCNLYCVRVIIVRLNKWSKPRSFEHN